MRPSTLIVGRNNAGKSTLIEALFIVSLVSNRLSALRTAPAPAWTGLDPYHRCLVASLRNTPINQEALFHRYGEPPAIITANFDGKASLRLYIGRDPEVYAVTHVNAAPVAGRKALRELGVAPIHILPQVGPLELEERVLTGGYVMAHAHTKLASRHFRNQIYLNGKAAEAFAELASETWPDLQVSPIEIIHGGERTLWLPVRERDFGAEIGLMGHGVQMWLQMLWFLAKTPTASTIILDEPDVYLHPDLQRKLFRIVQRSHGQSIIATHSVEIMAEADASDIVVIDRSNKRSRFTTNDPAVQRVIDQIGSVHNIHLVRLASARKLIMIEGDDLVLIRHWHKKLFPNSLSPIDSIPSFSLGGWGGWNRAVGSSLSTHSAMGDGVSIYCILDRDYHPDDIIAERLEEASQHNIHLHIWRRKEIENYLLCTTAFARVLRERMNEGQSSPTREMLDKKIFELGESYREQVLDEFADQLMRRDRRLTIASAKSRVGTWFNPRWRDEQGRIELLPGKSLLTDLTRWVQDEYGLSVGPAAIARSMTKSEIPPEVVQVITAIERRRGISEGGSG